MFYYQKVQLLLEKYQELHDKNSLMGLIDLAIEVKALLTNDEVVIYEENKLQEVINEHFNVRLFFKKS